MSGLGKIETRVTGLLDPHTKIVRSVCWALVCTNIAGAVYGVLQVNPISAVLAAASAVGLLWLLIKTRPVA